MVYLAPAIVTIAYVMFFAIGIVSTIKRKPHLRSKPGTLPNQWYERRRRLLLVLSAYVAVLYLGGLGGAAVADHGASSLFIDLIWGAVVGQIAVAVTITLFSSMIRGLVGVVRLGRNKS